MPFTTDCTCVSFDPQTTIDFPLLAHKASAVFAILFSKLIFPAEINGMPALEAIALYKLTTAAPVCEGLIPTRTSALAPDNDITLSN